MKVKLEQTICQIKKDKPVPVIDDIPDFQNITHLNYYLYDELLHPNVKLFKLKVKPSEC